MARPARPGRPNGSIWFCHRCRLRHPTPAPHPAPHSLHHHYSFRSSQLTTAVAGPLRRHYYGPHHPLAPPALVLWHHWSSVAFQIRICSQTPPPRATPATWDVRSQAKGLDARQKRDVDGLRPPVAATASLLVLRRVLSLFPFAFLAPCSGFRRRGPVSRQSCAAGCLPAGRPATPRPISPAASRALRIAATSGAALTYRHCQEIWPHCAAVTDPPRAAHLFSFHFRRRRRREARIVSRAAVLGSGLEGAVRCGAVGGVGGGGGG